MASPADYDVPGGHFFTQAAGDDASAGFAVIDDGDAKFWTEFQRLGGVRGVGFPVLARFEWDGFVVQVMQKGVFQWRPEAGRVYFVNVFDQMSLAGKDEWLSSTSSTPKILGPDFDAGQIVGPDRGRPAGAARREPGHQESILRRVGPPEPIRLTDLEGCGQRQSLCRAAAAGRHPAVEGRRAVGQGGAGNHRQRRRRRQRGRALPHGGAAADARGPAEVAAG